MTNIKESEVLMKVDFAPTSLCTHEYAEWRTGQSWQISFLSNEERQTFWSIDLNDYEGKSKP